LLNCNIFILATTNHNLPKIGGCLMDKIAVAIIITVILIAGVSAGYYNYYGQDQTNQTQLKDQNQTQLQNQTQYRNQTQNCTNNCSQIQNQTRYRNQTGDSIQDKDQNRTRVRTDG
jgi:uncharacterized protein HemX